MKFIIVCGPTCTGKTELGVELAKRYDGEIINADSRQIYKHTDIGTAKPTAEEMQGIRHHLFDFLELSEIFSAYEYAVRSRKIIKELLARNKMPVVVGGTGLYLKALTEGIFKSPKPDYKYRRKLEQIAGDGGTAKLHDMLAKVDPAAAERLNPNDRVRLIRALEIHKQTGRPISELQKSGDYLPSFWEPLWIGLDFKRKYLYERINKRVDKMLEDGFELEIKRLEPYLDFIRKRKMIGYVDMIGYLFDQELSREEAIARVKQHHRNYAKRQLTWFRKVDRINWFDPSHAGFNSDVFGLSDSFLKKT